MDAIVTDKPLRILMVTAWPPTDEAGGVSTVVRTLSRELSGAHGVQVLVNDWDATSLRTDRVGGLVTHALRLRSPYDAKRPVAGFLGWLRDFPRILWQLRRLLRAQAIDVVHLHFAASYQFYFRLVRALGGPPYVVTLHRGDTVDFGVLPMADRSLIRWMLRGAGGVVAVSDWLAERAGRTFPETRDIACIHNGLNLSSFDTHRNNGAKGNLPVELPATFFVNVANVTYYKGQDVAIRAWAQLQQRFPDLHLLIVGERREHWEACAELIRTLDLEDRVHMLGALPRKDVFTVLGRATGMVFPSRNEGFGLVVLEAGAMKLPVVCSDIPPLTEIVEGEESALLVPPENPDAIAEAVARLTDDAGLRERLGQALHERVAEEFTVEKMASHYVAVYREVLQGVSGRRRLTSV